jgi:hypothetical protein
MNFEGMKKTIITLTAALLLPLPQLFCKIHFKTSNFTYGFEWGYSETIFRYYDYNFITHEGDRLHDTGKGTVFHSNGQFFLKAGYDLTEHFNLSAQAGYEGLYKNNRFYPLSIRGTYLTGKKGKNRYFTFAEAGIGLDNKLADSHNDIYKCGWGLRLPLDCKTDMDIIFALQAGYSHPELTDPDTLEPVNQDKIGSSDAWFVSASVGIAINF